MTLSILVWQHNIAQYDSAHITFYMAERLLKKILNLTLKYM